MIRHIRAALALSALLAAGALSAAEGGDAELRQLRDALAKRLPPSMLGTLSPSPVPGLYELQLDTGLVYVSADGRFILQGDIFDLDQQRNITRVRRAELRSEALKSLGEEHMIVYQPDQPRYQVTVFTDIDCPYCRKMHSEMAGYLARGIRVRYLFYPRAGKGTPSYDAAVSVWCADDRRQAMDAAMSGGTLVPKTCANPVDAQLALGDQLGIKGTPAIVLDDGTVLDGYRPPEWLYKALQARAGEDQ